MSRQLCTDMSCKCISSLAGVLIVAHADLDLAVQHIRVTCAQRNSCWKEMRRERDDIERSLDELPSDADLWTTSGIGVVSMYAQTGTEYVHVYIQVYMYSCIDTCVHVGTYTCICMYIDAGMYRVYA